ncbi:MAG: hypothetical protein K0R41_1133 [Geminicoccaceae bacterium]|jgi:uncharacterized protein YjiS (DUF1127 family)|nr:hypothetical protein [Geminicoccaceae bacterium]MCE3247308.1 hypothetical protein [Geminicoccaceae bacterium]MDF2780537.1 hypothetical protein [Geminicoccaceae bacterium]
MSILHSAPVSLAVPRANRAAADANIRWRDVLAAVIDQLMTWQERARQRHQLQSLSDHMLHDIGLGRADVEAEGSKPFWRP